MNYNMIAFSRHGRYMNKLIAAVPYGKQLLFEKVLDSHFPEHETIREYQLPSQALREHYLIEKSLQARP